MSDTKEFLDFKNFLAENCYDLKQYKDGKYDEVIFNWFRNRQIVSFENPWEFESIVSTHFNQLKAKLFNLAESVSQTEKQADAQIGLLKGFCNEHYKNLITDLRFFLKEKGFLPKNEDSSLPPFSAEPLN